MILFLSVYFVSSLSHRMKCFVCSVCGCSGDLMFSSLCRFSLSGSSGSSICSSASSVYATSSVDERTLSSAPATSGTSPSLCSRTAPTAPSSTCGWIRRSRSVAGGQSSPHRSRRHDRWSQTAARSKGLKHPHILSHQQNHLLTLITSNPQSHELYSVEQKDS